MPLTVGQSLAHYRVVEKIGEGGMGEVYKAEDTTLNRDVAIKVLPELVAQETERLARFEREARMLATLNHPNIAAIYGLHEADGQRFIAMELVSGEDLAQRVARGPLAIDEALDIARHIAQALEAAHDRGVIHRDLKPANVRLADDGTVKVLDFGLAKAFEPESDAGGANLSHSPTMTSAGTMAGVILGTAAYMSPEQARGKPVDKRADIWALGCVLFEMLTGRAPFQGETVTDVLAGVVQTEPDWAALPPATPAAARRLIERCLSKDVGRRLRDAGDVGLELEDARSGAAEPAATTSPAVGRSSPWPVLLPWSMVAILAVAMLSLWFGQAAQPPEAIRFTMDLPNGLTLMSPNISPDGRTVAMTNTNLSGALELWVRSIHETTPRLVPGTEGIFFPFWSPDSRSIGFFQKGKMRRVDLESGTILTLADAPNGRGGTWNEAGDIIFAPEGRDGLYHVSENGGTPRPVTRLEPGSEVTSHRFPHFFPDGRRFTYFAPVSDTPSGVAYVGSLDGDEPVQLFEGRSEVYVRGNRLFHVREGTLIAQSFDRDLDPVGEAITLAHDIGTSVPSWGRAAFSVAENGTYIYQQHWTRKERLVWFDRTGRPMEELTPPGQYITPALSPDEQRMAFATSEQGDTQALWLLESSRGTLTQLTTNADMSAAAWSPDGKSIIYVAGRAIYRQSLGSLEPAEILMPPQPTDDPSVPTVPGGLHPSPDNTFLALDNWNSSTDWDIWIIPLQGESKPIRFVAAPMSQRAARVSPDSRWIAYESGESGQPEVYVRGYPDGRQTIISSGGGTAPAWRGDGRELYYLSSDGKIVSVSFETKDGLQIGSPNPLFNLPAQGLQTFVVSRDGQRFLLNIPLEGQEAPALTVVMNGMPPA